MNRWDSTEILVKVVDSGSFSAAAEQLGLSKSHVSRQISQLENRLGVQLLNRTTRRLSLTETGQAYYQRCRSILSQLEEAEQAVLDLQAKPRGTLRLTVAGAFGERYIAPAAAEFMQKHPHVHIHLDFTSRNVDLLEEGYDLAIRAGTLKDSSLIARRIASRKLIICGSRDYLDRYGRPETIQSLKKHNCLVGSVATWRFREANGHHADVKVEGSWHSNNGHALLAAAEAGLGLVQLPRFYVHRELEAGRLIEVMNDFQPTDTAVWAVYPSNRHLSPKVRLFVEHMVERFAAIDYL
ncbi:LysR family transcriptional regulator [Pseudomaricurvus alkylphenolicus]|uniref:LysR substrate-binding domain-containing protein n=1 Tax=Pseudomaricurvus alkylphenolicus TaxID=1306991 RepID=UPI0014233EC4|nr:LysR substrate-binding domain-containing protein [Pseudomaricurvus alkylphenolicus]NIB43050.1 LysR family transcriptional regulator [Pseudomaricurvus alkylphenolicus]